MKPVLGPELNSSFWLAAIQASRILASFLVGIIVVRYLGAEDYGALALALSISGFFAAFGNAGLPRVVLRELTVPQAEGSPVVATALVLQALGSIVATAGAGLLCVVLDKPPEVTAMAIIFAAALAFTGGTVLQQVFLVGHAVKKSASANMTGIVAALTFRLALVAAKAEVVVFAIANLIQNAVVLLVSLNRARSLLGELPGRLRPNGATMCHLATAAWPLLLASLLQGIPLYSDRLIIDASLTLQDVGRYAVLLQLISIPQMLIASLVAGASPRLIRAFAADEGSGARAEVVASLAAATSVGVVLLAGLAVVAPFAVPFLYGEGFTAPPSLVVPLCLGLFVIIPGMLRAEYLLVCGQQRLAIAIAGIHAVVTVAIQATLIPMLGLHGAALGYLLQSIVFAAVLNHFFPTLNFYARLYWEALGRGVTLLPLLHLVRRLAAERMTKPEG